MGNVSAHEPLFDLAHLLADPDFQERLDGHLASPEVTARLAALPYVTIEISGTFADPARLPRYSYRYEPPVP